MHLDDRKVTDDQREEAERLYKRPLLERIVKPNAGGFSQLMTKSVTWSSMQSKIFSFLGKDKEQTRNLLI